MSIAADRMKAAVLYGPKDLRYEEVPVPQTEAGDVLIKIKMNGLCGSDIHFYENGELGPFKVTQPYIPGHEACGEIVEINGTVKGSAVGRRVAIEPGIPCRRCEFCKTGRYNLCQDVVFLSAPPINGTFAEYAALPADFAHPLPDAVDDEAGAFVEPISVGIQACQRARLHAASRVAILGAGPIGLVTFLVARAYGATEVYLIDMLAHRLELGQTLGASACINPRQTDPVEALTELTKGRGADIVFDTSGSSQACALAPRLAVRGGVVTLVGWPEQSAFTYPVEVIIEKELDVRGVNRYCNTYPKAIALLAAGKIDVAPLISHRFQSEHVCDAFEFASENRSATIKVMIAQN
jgi:L-iditol 2-dehydrogenase